MVAAVAFISLAFVGLHAIDNPGFATGCLAIATMLSSIGAYILAGRVKIERRLSKFGGGWNVFWTTAVCTSIVIIASSLANAGKQAAFQIEPWKIYTYYVIISIGEECYYRLMLCQGIVILLSSRNRVGGWTSAALVTVFAFIAGFQVSTMSRIVFFIVSIAIFTASILIIGQNEGKPSLLASVVGVAISTSTFTLCHWNVYSNFPEMLIALTVGGAAMAIFLLATKNPFVPFFAHFALNLRSLQGIILN